MTERGSCSLPVHQGDGKRGRGGRPLTSPVFVFEKAACTGMVTVALSVNDPL